MIVRVLGSGSAGNAAVIASGSTALLVDAGFRTRELERRCGEAGYAPERLSGILLTHEHGDHCLGAVDFAEKFGVPIFCSRGTASAIGLDGSLFGSFVPLASGSERRIGDVLVRALGTAHDANESLAFRFEDGAGACVVATDMGHCPDELVGFASRANALFFEFNHDEEMLRDGPYHWSLKKRISGGLGHLSNRQSAEALARLAWEGLRRVVALHLSRQNNDPALVRAALSDALLRAESGAPFGCADQDHGYEAVEV